MESITTYMEQDHAVIDGFAGRAVQAAQARDPGTLQSEAGEFLRRLRRHIEMEEEVLFPVFEERTGMVAAGPSRQMRNEHDQMRPLLAQMEQAAAQQDGAGFERAAQALFDILQPHNMKEERIMYPSIENAAGTDAPALLQRVKAMAV